MRILPAAIVPCVAVAGCASPHVFEVVAQGAARAVLTLNGETGDMSGTEHGFEASRPPVGGSGEIGIFYADGRHVTCAIGYVSAYDLEPHRFVVEEGRCLQP